MSARSGLVGNKSSWPHLGPSGPIFCVGQKNPKNAKILHSFLGGPMGIPDIRYWTRDHEIYSGRMAHSWPSPSSHARQSTWYEAQSTVIPIHLHSSICTVWPIIIHLANSKRFFIFLRMFCHFMALLGVRRGFKMILSHRALTSLNMSSYRAIWTHFRPNFILVGPKISD